LALDFATALTPRDGARDSVDDIIPAFARIWRKRLPR
jgi:hypothetical protein